MSSSAEERIAALEERVRAMQFAHEHLAHDVRNPLAGLVTALELLSTEPTVVGDEDVAALVASARHATERLDALVEQLLG